MLYLCPFHCLTVGAAIVQRWNQLRAFIAVERALLQPASARAHARQPRARADNGRGNKWKRKRKLARALFTSDAQQVAASSHLLRSLQRRSKALREPSKGRRNVGSVAKLSSLALGLSVEKFPARSPRRQMRARLCSLCGRRANELTASHNHRGWRVIGSCSALPATKRTLLRRA